MFSESRPAAGAVAVAQGWRQAWLAWGMCRWSRGRWRRAWGEPPEMSAPPPARTSLPRCLRHPTAAVGRRLSSLPFHLHLLCGHSRPVASSAAVGGRWGLGLRASCWGQAGGSRSSLPIASLMLLGVVARSAPIERRPLSALCWICCGAAALEREGASGVLLLGCRYRWTAE